jgi:hypothetical protein
MIYAIVNYRTQSSIRRISSFFCLVLALYAAPAHAVSDVDGDATAIVIGFVGGFVRHDDSVHSAVQVAAHLRKNYPADVHTEIIENRRREEAHAEIIRFVDSDHNGTLSDEEKKNARIILYGHSWGASTAVTLARELDREGIPVLLTVQVDSVSRFGENDRVIPANVAEAANFYQLDGLLHGEPQIRAADPKRTHIIGNFRLDYKTNPVECKQYPWYDRVFMKFHTEIECDPKVWTQVESLIESRLPKQH